MAIIRIMQPSQQSSIEFFLTVLTFLITAVGLAIQLRDRRTSVRVELRPTYKHQIGVSVTPMLKARIINSGKVRVVMDSDPVFVIVANQRSKSGHHFIPGKWDHSPGQSKLALEPGDIADYLVEATPVRQLMNQDSHPPQSRLRIRVSIVGQGDIWSNACNVNHQNLKEPMPEHRQSFLPPLAPHRVRR
jgi:hypothetical protein